MTSPTTQVTVSRRIGADPTSTALLLAGPSAVDLWPGVERVSRVDGLILVEATLGTGASRPAAVAVSARPPKRTPTSFVTTFAWTGPDLPEAVGTLTLTYAAVVGGGVPRAHAELVLQVGALESSPLDVRALTAMAEGFLDNLAAAAEARRAA